MKLSVIIVNFRSWKRLRLCLESLRCLHAAPFSWEVIVVDNRSADAALPEFIYDFPEFNFVESSGNYGFAYGCNLGVRKACGEFYLFLNPDTAVTLPVLEKLCQTAESHPEFTILSCSQVTDNGKDTRPYGFSLEPRTLTSFLRFIHKSTNAGFLTTQLDSGEEILYPDWVSGSVVLIHREKFAKLEGWSEDFWMYFEDADLCRRVWKSGGLVALLCDTRIIHNHGGASRINIGIKALTKSEVIISRHVYLHKHSDGMRRWVMQTYLIVNNLLLFHLLLAIVGAIFFFVPAIHVYTRLYQRLVKYYIGAIKNKTWISRRSVNYKRIPVASVKKNRIAEAPQLK